MSSVRRRIATTTKLVAGLSAGLLVAASAAYAAGLETSANLSTNNSLPTLVNIGDNTFTIFVSANGQVPDGKPGTATVTTQYTMATDGTITASSLAADQSTLTFADDYNYSQCASEVPHNAQGCSTNPFVVTAHLTVAAGTPGGTTGTLTTANTGSEGLGADTSPAIGYVQVAASNHAPSQPGAPTLQAGSVTPNNTGNFTVEWTGSTDSDAGDTVTYTLQKRDADDADWTTVASDIASTSYTFSGEAEGSWRYQVKAVDNHGASSAYATDATPIVVVDKSNPNAPTPSTVPASAYTDGGGTHWYKDSVTVSFTSAGDPILSDGSSGSGVASVTAPTTWDFTNVGSDYSFSVTGTATDNATNVSSGTTVSGKVDYQAPTVQATCPTGTVLLHATASASWVASDLGSGLASTPTSGTVALDTSSVGSHTATVPAGTATDNVGHTSAAATCNYSVGYAFSGFLQPINDTAHFIGLTTSIFKGGSTVPVKFQLLDANGVPQQAATAPVWLMPTKGNALPSSATVDESSYTTTATPGGTFRWDATSQQYIYNWNTTKGQTGFYWRIGASIDDGTTYNVSIGLR